MKYTFLFNASILCLSLAITGCQTNSGTVETESTVTPQINCSAPPPIHDIWSLEPMLKEQGKINDSMTRDEKEEVIREYIRKKNSKFEKCGKGK